MSEPKLRETMWAEMKPDVYGGATCEEHVPRWWSYCRDDMNDGYTTEDIALSAGHFPPGTRVIVLEPHCPDCGEAPTEIQEADGTEKWACSCEFDWRKWATDKYS